jgi:hypothetical protein
MFDSKTYHREYMRKYNKENPEYVEARNALQHKKRKRRVYWLAKYKVAKGCTICGYNEHPAALDFDHTDPTTKQCGGVRAMLSGMYSLKRVFEEIRKCTLMCANCHRAKTNPHMDT